MSQLETALDKLTIAPWWEDGVLADQERLAPALEGVLERVERARGSARMPASLLLTGPRGLGREWVAVELAAMMTCPGGGARGCDCGSCTRVRKGIHPDVRRVPKPENRKHIVIEQVREIVESAAGHPYEGMARVWILEGAEAGNLGREAANAFLKVLEEPPPHARFILLAANPEAVLPTIRSRCQQLHLPGSVAMAGVSSDACAAPELLATVGAAAGELVEATAVSLEEALGGEPLALVLAARRLAQAGEPYQVAALAALELAGRNEGSEPGEGFVRLAADLLEAGRAARTLNLKSHDRRVISCFMDWYRKEISA
ncbi:MAG: hypothetical protein GXP47_08565 [Acidobacteria bacterium]|nr:hypothetical protein [Acidobacteriota bacterium]